MMVAQLQVTIWGNCRWLLAKDAVGCRVAKSCAVLVHVNIYGSRPLSTSATHACPSFGQCPRFGPRTRPYVPLFSTHNPGTILIRFSATSDRPCLLSIVFIRSRFEIQLFAQKLVPEKASNNSGWNVEETHRITIIQLMVPSPIIRVLKPRNPTISLLCLRRHRSLPL